MPMMSSRADRLAELAATNPADDTAPQLSSWRGQHSGLSGTVNLLQNQHLNTSDQLKSMLEENLRLKMSSESLKDELDAKRNELSTRQAEANARKFEACYSCVDLSRFVLMLSCRCATLFDWGG